MSFFAVDIFKDQTDANVFAQAMQQAGRKNIQIKETDSTIVNDCRTKPPTAVLDINAGPLFIVLSEG